MSEKVDAAYETAEMSGDYRVLCDLLLEDNQRLQAALREIMDTYMSCENDYESAALMYQRAKEALGDAM